MSLNAHEENRLTLTRLLGLGEEEAESLLADRVLLTYDSEDPSSNRLANHLLAVLRRTFSNIYAEPSGSEAVEIILGKVSARTRDTIHVYASGSESTTVLIATARPSGLGLTPGLPGSLEILVACYIAAFAMRQLLGTRVPDLEHPDSIVLDLGALFPDWTFFDAPIDIGFTRLAGAGAIGNGFMYALQSFDVRGALEISDGDRVSDGNLNRCLWFDGSHVGEMKAPTLAEVARPHFPNLELLAHPGTISDLPAKQAGGPWLDRLVVGVDSRRARRSLNTEVPGEVYDASTTDVREAFFHFSRRPLRGLACLECAYPIDPMEQAHEQHVAGVLGLSLNHVRELTISPDAARTIAVRYPSYAVHELVGQSYDTLFKELCGKGRIIDKDQTQVLAPFAFVSVLAGTVLAIEFAHRISSGSDGYNSFRVSPWTSPVLRLRQVVRTNAACSFCGNAVKAEYAETLWANRGGSAAASE